MSDFKITERIAVIGQGAHWTLELNRVSIDGKEPRLHIGKWTDEGSHRRFYGFLTEEEAKKLSDALLTLAE